MKIKENTESTELFTYKLFCDVENKNEMQNKHNKNNVNK